jgi:DNA ligase (NAD+)
MSHWELYKKISILADEILRHKELYYQGHPEINDQDYDQLEDSLRGISPNHPVLSFVGSTKIDTTEKVQHRRSMLSLDKTYAVKDLFSWGDDRDLVGTLKVDGNSISLIYQKGKLVLAKTRGNGRMGEDVTKKIQWVSDIPRQLPEAIDCEVRGELYCRRSQFFRLSEQMEQNHLERPTSPRNIVAGVLGRRSHIEDARFFNFFAFDFLPDGEPPLLFESETSKMDKLELSGFTVPEHCLLNSNEQINDFLVRVEKLMNEDEIQLDGAVFTLDQIALHAELGDTAHHPRYKMAFKWQGQTAKALIKDIQWATSRLGAVTPVAVIDPVFLSGASISNITLHNAALVRTYDLKVGDQIEIVRSGEVIPKFLRVVRDGQGALRWPEHCPSCHAGLEFDEVRLKCPNTSSCPAQIIRSILNWIKCAEIDDLSDKRLEIMIERKLVNDIPSLYAVTMEQLLTLPQTKDKLAGKIFNNIQKSKKLTLAQFLTGLGIEGTGSTSWEKLLENFDGLEALQTATVEDLVAVDGFAAKSASATVEGLKVKGPVIKALFEQGLTPQHKQAAHSRASTALGDMVFVITGSLSKPRAEIEKLIKAHGGKISSCVSAKTTAVVSNDVESNSSKFKKAQSLSIPIWNEQRLLEEL